MPALVPDEAAAESPGAEEVPRSPAGRPWQRRAAIAREQGRTITAGQGRDREPMPRWLRRAIAFLLLGAAGLFVAFWLVSRLRSLIVMLLVSLFLAFAMEPAANFLARRGWRRGLATAAVFAVLVAVVVVLVTALGSLFVDQVAELIDAIPGYAQQVASFLNDHFGTDLESSKLATQVRSNEGVRTFVTGVAAAAVGLSTTLIGLLLQGFAVGLFTFYLIADGPRLRRTVCSVLRPDRQQLALRIWELAAESTGGYVYSRALLAGVSATATTLFLAVIDVPYPLALGLWVGLVSQFVPTIGTYLAGALPVLIALFHDPVDALWVLAFITVYQQFENLVLSPRITARTMSLHPAVAFGAVIAGGAILGPIGALLALPAAASIQSLVTLYVRRYEVVASPLTVEQALGQQEAPAPGP
jgi:predicted PurR-regulated permease PerM